MSMRMHSPATRQGIFAAALLIPAGAVLGLHAYLGGHTRLIADDFCSAYYAQRLGLLRSIWYWYLNWSGRYTAFGADWLMENIGVYALWIMPPLVLLAWLVFTVLALYLALRHVLPEDAVKFSAGTLGVVFLFVVLLLSPLVLQSVYWWNAMRSYSLPLALLTLYAVLLQVGLDRLKTRNDVNIGAIVSFLFLFANGGLGETYVVFQVMLLAVLLFLEWLVHGSWTSARFRWLLAGWLGSLAALTVVALAPGNAIRQSLYPPQPDLWTLLQVNTQSYLDLLATIARTTEQLAGLLGAFLTAGWFGTQCTRTSTKSRLLFLALGVVALVLSFACLLPGVYATSEPSPPRTMIIPVFIFVAGLLGAGFMLGQQWIGSYRAATILPAGAVLLVGYAAIVSGTTIYGTRQMYLDFAQRWDQADAQILQAKAHGDEAVNIPRMNVWTGPGGDPIDNPKYWVNQCYSLYYGITVLGPNPDLQP